LNKELKN